jgi:hypothetical protein
LALKLLLFDDWCQIEDSCSSKWKFKRRRFVPEVLDTVTRWANDGELVAVTYDLATRTSTEVVRVFVTPIGMDDTQDSEASEELAVEYEEAILATAE